MTLFSGLLRFFGLGGINKPDKGPQNHNISSATDAGISVSNERALQVSAVWDCVQLIVNSVSSLPLIISKEMARGEYEPVTGAHYLIELLQGRPNFLMKSRDFRKAMTAQLCLWCNAYAYIEWNNAGTRPLALIPLKPGRMTPFITESGELQYHYKTDKGVNVWAKKSILHLKGFGIDGITGFERVDFMAKALGISVSADVYASKQFASGGKNGGGYLYIDQILNPEQRKQAKALYADLTETAYNKGDIWILEGGMKYEPDTLNPDTMQMLETRNYQISEICRFFGVPEVLISSGEGKAAWPASLEKHLLAFLQFTLQDYIDEWETAIIDSLVVDPKEKGKIKVDHDVTDFIKMDAATRADVEAKRVQNGLKTRNEIRRKNGDPADPEGDRLTVQVNLTELGDLPSPNPSSSDNTSLETVQQ